MLYTNAQLVEKESISNLKFPKEEVLGNAGEVAERTKRLANAQSLGNLEKHKVQIVFKDNSAIKMVHTTIWSITEQNIILKSNVNIPITRILDIVLL
jgi:hypothetical protein